MLGNGPPVLRNGPPVLRNGPQVLRKAEIGHMCYEMGRMLGLSHSRLCCIRGYVLRDYAALGVMLAIFESQKNK